VQASDAAKDPPASAPAARPSLLADFSDALIVCDRAGNVVYLNARAERLLDCDGSLALGRPVLSALSLELRGGGLLDERKIAELAAQGLGREVVGSGMLLGVKGQRRMVAYELVSLGESLLILLRAEADVVERGTLAYRASHDALTGLPNRAYLQERLENLHRSAEAQQGIYSLLLVDLDYFKIINDRYGHATGDQVLAQVARRIAHKVRELDTVGRWGGEEFLCLLPQVGRSQAEEVAERIRAGLEAQPVEDEGRQIRVTASIGVAAYPDDGLHPDALLAKVDAALYEAKRAGRNRIQSITRHAGNVFALANMIEKSLKDNRIEPAYQSVVNLVSGEVCGAEALARIRLDDGQVMEAAYFIPAAEQLHLVHLIDHRVIHSAILRCVRSALAGGPVPAMFVNFSADFLRHPKLVAEILETVKEQCAVCGDYVGSVKPLVIEVTERQFLDDMRGAREALKPFIDLGLRLAIDDFGVGYSSLNYLAELPVSFIKLERALVGRITAEPRVRAIVQGIQELAADLGVITVAEGVERSETLQALQEIGVDWGQGHLFSHPVLDD
jgi:diguanylate cyclase (GGDEF)-like protein